MVQQVVAFQISKFVLWFTPSVTWSTAVSLSQYSVQSEQLQWFADCVFVLCVSCRNPSSPRQTCGPGGQQLGGDGPLAAAGFIRSLCCQQLHCGVQTGRYVWKQLDYYFKCAVAKLETKRFLFSQTRCCGSRWPAAERSAFRSTLWSREVTTSSECEPPTAGGSARHPSPQTWSRCPALVSLRV